MLLFFFVCVIEVFIFFFSESLIQKHSNLRIFKDCLVVVNILRIESKLIGMRSCRDFDTSCIS